MTPSPPQPPSVPLSPPQVQQPAWSPAPPPSSTPPAAPQTMAAPAPDLTRTYAEWFDWASTQFGGDHKAHLATQTAVAALQGGADAPAAVLAGEQAGNALDAAARPVTADMPTQAYAAWFTW